MASSAESTSVQKKKKKNLFASLFQKNKTKSKHKDKDKTLANARAHNAVEKASDNVTVIGIDRATDGTAANTSAIVPDSNIQYVHSVKRRQAPRPPAVEQSLTISSHQLDSTMVTSAERREESAVRHQQELAVLNDSCADVQTCVARSRSSSHSSGFDEVSSSMTECSCNVEQTKPLAIASSLTPVVDALSSNVTSSDDNNNISSQSPVVVADDVVCDETATKDEEPATEEIHKQDSLNDVSEPQRNDDVKVEGSSNDITPSPCESVATTESTAIPCPHVVIGSNDVTSATLVKLRELSVRIARPSSLTSIAPDTDHTVSPGNKTRTYALNTAYRNMIAAGTVRSPTSLSEQSPLRQLATKWRQPSLPKTSVNTNAVAVPAALPNAGGRTSTSAPARSLRRSRSSSPGDNTCKPVLRSQLSANDAASCTSSSDVTRSPTDLTFRPTLLTQRSVNDVISYTSSSVTSHHDDIDDVVSCHSNADADSSVFVHDASQQRRYSSAMELSQSARDVVINAKVKKAVQRRLDVWNMSAKTVACQSSSELELDAVPLNHSESGISFSVDEINRLSAVSTDNNQTRRITRQPVSKPATRRTRPSVNADTATHIRHTSQHRSMSDRYAELTQSLTRWGKQFADMTPSMSSSAHSQHMKSNEQDQLEVIQETSSPPWSPPGDRQTSSADGCGKTPAGRDNYGTEPTNVHLSNVTFKESGVHDLTDTKNSNDDDDVIAQTNFKSTNDLTAGAAADAATDAAGARYVKDRRTLQRSYSTPTQCVQAAELPRTSMIRLNEDGTPRSILKKTND